MVSLISESDGWFVGGERGMEMALWVEIKITSVEMTWLVNMLVGREASGEKH